MGAQAKTPFPLWAWGAAVVLFPLLSAINWPVSYSLYAVLILVVIADTYRFGHMKLERSWPTIAKWAALLLATLVHIRAAGQLANFASLILADVALMMTMRRYGWDPDYSRPFFRVLLWVMVAGAVLGLAFSAVFAGQFGFSNPFLDLIHGQRVRIYSNFRIGHSMLADYAFVAGLLGISNIGRMAVPVRLAVVGASIATLILTSTATSWLLIGVLGCVFIAEAIFRAWRLAFYGVFAFAGAYFTINPDALMGMMAFVRFQLLHRYAASYGGDLTAGRKLLNELYGGAIAQHPIVGIGHDAPLMLYGAQVATGRMLYTPISETPLRFPAEYGALAGLALLAFVLAPLRAFNAPRQDVRIMAIGLSLGLLVWMSSNSLFNVAHAPQYVLYGGLLLIMSAKQFRGEAAKVRRKVGPMLFSAPKTA